MAKYAQVAQEHGFSFIPAIFSHTGQVHQAAMDLMFNQIKHKMELADPEVQSGEVQNVLNFWVQQLSCVINRTACRSILAGATSLVDSVNASSGDAWTSVQCDELLAANSHAAYKFLEDLEIPMINHDLMQL